jgi:putative SOS response-associated peptidase YedK
MCGRYTLYQQGKLPGLFKVPKSEASRFKERYNIAPSQSVPVVIRRDDGNHLEEMRWGFMTPWMKDPKDMFKYSMFNARAEGIFDKPTWKKAIRFQRCLVPSNGFYEWKKEDDGKHPFLIRPKDQELFAFGGVYGNWKDAEGVEWGTYSIVTTTPNKEMSSIHSREPLMLKPEDQDLWLDPSMDEPDAIAELLRPYKDGMLQMYEVSRDVNSAKSDIASYIEPLNSQ